MRRAPILTNALLWAAAIIAAAVIGAPTFLSLILLPSLGFMSMLVSSQRRGDMQRARSIRDGSP